MSKSILKVLEATGARIETNVPLYKYTSLKVGGPARYFSNVFDETMLKKLYVSAYHLNIPVFILGMGTNILVGDKGFSGLVIRDNVSGITIGKEGKADLSKSNKFRWAKTAWREGFLTLSDINFDISTSKVITVTLNAGTALSYTIHTLLNKGITGLEYFSGIPGTIGGAVWNNIHGGEWLFEDFLQTVHVLYPDGTEAMLSKGDLGLHYDFSMFHKTNALILNSTLLLPLGDKKRSLFVADEWRKRKMFQPRNSAGCTFANISEEDRVSANLENCGTGYIIDKILNMRGYRVGDAWISDKHANFIVTGPNASAGNVVSIIETVKERVRAELNISLREEIVRVGDF